MGKSTFCRALAEEMHASHISAGALLRRSGFVRPGQYGIPNPRENQAHLQQVLQEYRDQHKNEQIVLDGHFCLLTPLYKVQVLPYGLFQSMNAAAFLIVVDDPSEISKRLAHREGTDLPAILLDGLQRREVARARAVTRQLQVALREITPYVPAAEVAQWIRGLNQMSNR